MGKDTFIFRLSWVEAMEELPEAVQAELYKAIPLYAMTGKTPQLSAIAKAVFSFIRLDMDKDCQKYEEAVTRRSNGGRRGGRPKIFESGMQDYSEEQQEQADLFPQDEESADAQDENLKVSENANENIDETKNLKVSKKPQGFSDEQNNLKVFEKPQGFNDAQKNLKVISENSPYTRRDNDSVYDCVYDNEKDKSFSSCYSTPNPFQGASEEEKQKIHLLVVFFFNNYRDPAAEVDKFLAYNNTGGRVWAKMEEEERKSCLNLWRQKDGDGKTVPADRLPEGDLARWWDIYSLMIASQAPEQVLRDALDKDIKFAPNPRDKTILTLFVPPSVHEYIERNLSVFEAKLREYMAEKGYTKLNYKIIKHT